MRLLEHVDGMNIMAQAIVKCLPSTAAIMILLMSNIVMFSIIGMNVRACTVHRDALAARVPSMI